MPEQALSANTKERVASYVYFGSLYFVTVGALYLWGYWSPFGVNILEYLALSDILKITAYPIATALLLSAVGAAIGETLVSEDRLPPGGGKDTRIGQFLLRFAPMLVGAYVIGTVTLLLFGPVEKWRALPVLLGLPFYVFAKQTGVMSGFIPRESPRSVVLYVLAVLPALGYGHGTLAAEKIQNAKAFAYVVSELPGYAAGDDAMKQPRLLGTAGDTIFFFDPAKAAVVLLRLETGKVIVLKQYEAPKTPLAAARSNPSLKGTSAGKPASAP
jgi:hypothetical protein